MQAVRLPTQTYFVSVDHSVLIAGMTLIEEQFEDLAKNGLQAEGLPDGCYAAGQYLNPYSINQRGLYGTAAALLVFSRSAPSQERMEFIEGLIRYVAHRPQIEQELARSDSDRSALNARLATEWQTAFKCADLLYALSAAPPATTGREELINRLLDRIHSGRRADGGWAVDLDPDRERDPLATASIVRSLAAAGIAPRDTDVELVRADLHDDRRVSIHVRLFCLLTLLEITDGDTELNDLWKRFLNELAPQLNARTEVNYEFTFANHYHYVRVPWQLHLLACAALCSPVSVLFNRHVRKVLLDCLAALNSTEGFIYRSSGHMRSTRTYSILMDTLWKIDRALSAARYLIPLSTIANAVVRIVYSRALASVLLIGALAISALSLWFWISDGKAPLGAVGPNLFTGGLLAVMGLVLRRLRHR